MTLYSNNRNRDDVVTIKIVNNTNGAVSCTYDTYIGGLVNPEYRWSLAVWVQEHGSGEGYQGDHILDCSNALEAYQSGGKTAYVLDLRDLYYLCTSGYPHNGTCGGIKWDAVSSGYSIDATMIGSSSELCGNNGVIDQGEDCDGTNLNGQTCVSRGFNGGVLVCSNRCRFDTSGCYNEPPETPIDLSALFSQGNGLYACTEAVAASCQKISEGSSLSLLGNNNDKFDYIAFNTPISAHFFEEINYSKPSIKITYAGSSAPDCAYQLYTKTDPATGMPVWERQDNNVFLPCSQDRRGWAPDALTSYTLDGGTAYLISLDSLCVLDDRETEPGDLGTSCALSWQDRISSLKEGREPVCGNGTVERGEECGEPGLSCEEGYECENCRCPRFVPLGLAEKIQNLYFWVVSLAGLVALGLIIFGGVMYAASGGNPSRISEAKSWITHALAGLGMLLAAYLILGFINPDLTKLQDIFLRVNVNTQAPGLELGEGGGVPGDYSCPAVGYTTNQPVGIGNFWNCRGCPGNDPVGVWGISCPSSCGRPHAGIDMPGTRGSDLLAAESGIATMCPTPCNGCGNGLTITGISGLTYSYCHLDRYTINSGQQVNAGQVVGYMGDTETPGAVHLHFGIRQGPHDPLGSTYYDPCGFLTAACSGFTCEDRSQYGKGRVPGF